MEELYELVENLKSYLDNLDDIKNIKDINKNLSKDVRAIAWMYSKALIPPTYIILRILSNNITKLSIRIL